MCYVLYLCNLLILSYFFILGRNPIFTDLMKPNRHFLDLRKLLEFPP